MNPKIKKTSFIRDLKICPFHGAFLGGLGLLIWYTIFYSYYFNEPIVYEVYSGQVKPLSWQSLVRFRRSPKNQLTLVKLANNPLPFNFRAAFQSGQVHEYKILRRLGLLQRGLWHNKLSDYEEAIIIDTSALNDSALNGNFLCDWNGKPFKSISNRQRVTLQQGYNEWNCFKKDERAKNTVMHWSAKTIVLLQDSNEF